MDRARLIRRGAVRVTAPPTPSPFAVEPPTVVYRRGQLDQLTHDLQTLAGEIEIHTIVFPEDLQVDAEGRTLNKGLRFSPQCFNTVSSGICPSMHQFLHEIGVAASRTWKNEMLVDWPFARDVYNHVVTLRFMLLRGLRFVVHKPTATVIGLAKPERRGGDLAEFLAGVEEARVDCRTGQTFYAAIRTCHKLQMWYREPKPFHTTAFDDDPQPLHLGSMFYWAGFVKCAMRGSPAVMTKAGVCLAPRKKFGVLTRWTGANVTAEAVIAAAKIFNAKLPVDVVCSNVDRWMDRPIGFPYGVDPHSVDVRFKAIVRAAGSLRPPHYFMRDVLDRAMNEAGGDVKLRPSSNDDKAKCTVGGFLGKLLAGARSLGLNYREDVETFAFHILTGRQI